MAIHILRSHDDLHLLLAYLQATRCLDRASTFAAKKGKDVVCLREKKVIVVICAGKSNIRRVDDICTWTEMWKQIQTISSLDSRQNLNEQKNHDGGKGKGVRAKGQKGKRTRGQKGKRAKTTNYDFPSFLANWPFLEENFLGPNFFDLQGSFQGPLWDKTVTHGGPSYLLDV